MALQEFQTPFGTCDVIASSWFALLILLNAHLVYAFSDKSDVHICWVKHRAILAMLIIHMYIDRTIEGTRVRAKFNRIKEISESGLRAVTYL